nr:dehydrogenase [Cytophagales bacterium]
LDKDGRLQEFTAACSPFYYRGIALPATYSGSVFVCEPSGNLIKRNQVYEEGFHLAAEDPAPGREFLASTDERFRPVSLASGPDGGLYIVDMYRGLVQHGAYITPYLREQTLSRNLVLPVNRGRIWRVLQKGYTSKPFPNLDSYALDKLVNTLFHQNGWHRDMAQRLLIERNDPESVALVKKAIKERPQRWGQLHALWTLEGLGGLEEDLLVTLVFDTDPYVAATALRLLEPFAEKNADIGETILSQPIPFSFIEKTPFTLQLALSAPKLFPSKAKAILKDIIAIDGDSPLIRDAVISGLKANQFAFMKSILEDSEWNTPNTDKEVFLEMLAGSIINAANPDEVRKLLAYLETTNPAENWKYTPILTAMTIIGGNKSQRSIPLQKAPRLLVKNQNLLPHQYNALSQLFSWPGNEIRKDSLHQTVLLTSEEQKLFASGRQHYLSTCSGCHGNAGEGVKRLGPPLAGSEWVTGDLKQLSLIVLHGMEGPVEVNGKVYDTPEILPVMPAHTTLDDGTLSAILTYIRNEWGNNAGAVERKFIATTRNVTQGRVIPWSAEELKSYLKAEQEQSP